MNTEQNYLDEGRGISQHGADSIANEAVSTK